jgi:hypothetical protein
LKAAASYLKLIPLHLLGRGEEQGNLVLENRLLIEVRQDKVKLSLYLTKHYAMKTHGGMDAWNHVFLSGQLHAPAELPPYPLDIRLNVLQNRCGRHAGEKSLAPTGTRTPTPRRFGPFPITIPSALTRFFSFSLES